MTIDKGKIVLTVGSECVLSGAPKTLMAALTKRLTLQNPKYQAAKKYGRWVGRKFPQKLYFYKKRDRGLIMPRGFAKDAVLECIELLGVQPEIVDTRRELLPISFDFFGKLRPYQTAAVEGVLSRDFGVLEAGTGSGKTVIALQVIAERKQPAFILVHTKELLYQWAERIKQFLHVDAALIGDGHFNIGPVTIGIVNSTRKNLETIPDNFGHILVDECHRVPASLFTDVVTRFDAKYSLGLSATAYRRENVLTKLIYFYMGSRSHKVDDKLLQESGAILKPEILFRPTGFTYRYRDDYAAMLTALSLDQGRNEQIADDAVCEAAKAGGILIVSDRVAHCERLAALITERGGKAAVLTGRLSPDKRSEIVGMVKNNALDILISTVQLIGEGFDAPGLTILFLATPIKFSGRLKQVVGRILRPGQDKQAKVFDYVDENVGILRNSAKKRQQTYLSYDL